MTNILELARRAREAGLRVDMFAPAFEIPDVHALLGVPLEPQLESLYRITDGCKMGSIDVFSASQSLVDMNRSMREILDYLPLLYDVLVCARLSRSSLELASMPAYADACGHQPIVLVDANEVPTILPLASTLNRALELAIIHEIGTSRDADWSEEGFPYSIVHFVASDIRLMELLHAGTFDDVGGGAIAESEWYELLRELAPA